MICFEFLRMVTRFNLSPVDSEPEGQFFSGDVSHRDKKLTNFAACCALDRERLLDLTLGNQFQLLEDLAKQFARLRNVFHVVTAPNELLNYTTRYWDSAHAWGRKSPGTPGPRRSTADGGWKGRSRTKSGWMEPGPCWKGGSCLA